MRYCICGESIPRRKEQGHREREYCSDRCRKRAWRARNKEKHNLERITREWKERFYNAVDQEIHRETWQDELEKQESLIHSLLLETKYLREMNNVQELVMQGLKEELAEKEAEIARLNTLLEYQAKRRSQHS
jgi:hypothetical protein